MTEEEDRTFVSLHTGDALATGPSDGYQGTDLTWSAGSSGEQTLSAMTIGDDVFEMTDGKFVHLGKGSLVTRLTLEGGELIFVPEEKE